MLHRKDAEDRKGEATGSFTRNSILRFLSKRRTGFQKKGLLQVRKSVTKEKTKQKSKRDGVESKTIDILKAGGTSSPVGERFAV